MSNFIRHTRNPDTGQFENAIWLDYFFGRDCYGVQFPPSATVHRADAYEWEFDDTSATDKAKP